MKPKKQIIVICFFGDINFYIFVFFVKVKYEARKNIFINNLLLLLHLNYPFEPFFNFGFCNPNSNWSAMWAK